MVAPERVQQYINVPPEGTAKEQVCLYVYLSDVCSYQVANATVGSLRACSR